MPIKHNNPKPTGIRGIKRDGPERFIVTVWRTDRKTGRQRKREGVAISLPEAIALQEELRKSARPEKSTRLKWRAFALRYAEERVSKLEPTTQERYVNDLGHIGTRFGDHFLDGIESTDVEDWIEEASSRYAAPTINGWLRTMRVALEWGVKRGVVQRNVARDVSTLAEGRTAGRRGVSLSASELRRLLEVADLMVDEGDLAEDVARMIHVVAWTGCRISELCALRFTDWEGDQLHIRRALSKRKVKRPKNNDPRVVTVVQPLAVALGRQRDWLAETQHPGRGSDLVFPARPQQAMAGARRRGVDVIDWQRSRSVLKIPLRRAAAKAGLPSLSAHAFRRTLENLMRKAQVDELVRRSVAGWRSRQAEAIYASVDNEDRAAAGAAMLALVMGSKTNTRGSNQKRPAEH